MSEGSASSVAAAARDEGKRRGEEEEARRAVERTIGAARTGELLGWISEQYAIPEDFVARLLGGRSEQTARRVRLDLERAGLIERAKLARGEPSWIWLTSKGQRRAGNGLRRWQPNLGKLAHVRAVGAVRLHVAEVAPEATWVAERILYRARSGREHIADAALHLPDGKRYAIEVELSFKGAARTEAIVAELDRDFDGIYYFAGSAVWPMLARMPLPGSLRLRELPAGSTPKLRAC